MAIARLSGATTLLLSLRIGYLPVSNMERRSWEERVTSYYPGLADADERESLAYHWHPHIAQLPFPPLHLGPGAKVGRPELQTAHLPGGAVALPDVVPLAVRDFGVTPLRRDWQAVLAAQN